MAPTRGGEAGEREVPAIPEHPQPEGRAAAIYVAVAKLRRWAGNPRKNDPTIEKCAASIRAFGFGAPLLAVLDTGEIIAGDTRIQAAELVGLAEVPVRYMSLPELKAHALAMADNAVPGASEWEKRELAAQLKLLVDAGEDLGPIGFDDEDLSKLLAEPEETKVEEVDVSEVQDEFWLSVRGPLPKQPEALEHLRKALASLEGVQVDMGTIE